MEKDEKGKVWTEKVGLKEHDLKVKFLTENVRAGPTV